MTKQLFLILGLMINIHLLGAATSSTWTQTAKKHWKPIATAATVVMGVVAWQRGYSSIIRVPASEHFPNLKNYTFTVTHISSSRAKAILQTRIEEIRRAESFGDPVRFGNCSVTWCLGLFTTHKTEVAYN